jgi:hypothetical protein
METFTILFQYLPGMRVENIQLLNVNKQSYNSIHEHPNNQTCYTHILYVPEHIMRASYFNFHKKTNNGNLTFMNKVKHTPNVKWFLGKETFSNCGMFWNSDIQSYWYENISHVTIIIFSLSSHAVYLISLFLEPWLCFWGIFHNNATSIRCSILLFLCYHSTEQNDAESRNFFIYILISILSPSGDHNRGYGEWHPRGTRATQCPGV